MARLERAICSGKGKDQSEANRMPLEYRRYIPDPLIGRTFTFSESVQVSISQAEVALRTVSFQPTFTQHSEAVARLMLRAEAIASSRIAGQVLVARRILRAELEMNLVGDTPDLCSNEVLANIQALNYGIHQVRENSEISLDLILKIHERMMMTGNNPTTAGHFRQEQNWIGGDKFLPNNAEYIPPPSVRVLGLMQDLVAFCNRDDLSPVVQAAIALAQFETIRPFTDGNGRTGRVLVQLVFRRRGVPFKGLPPFSLVMATRSTDLITGLSAIRYLGNCQSAKAVEGIEDWVSLFATACLKSVSEISEFRNQMSAVEKLWRKKLGHVRDESPLDLLLQKLVGTPVIDVTSAMKIINRCFAETSTAISILVSSGILTEINLSAHNRAFEAPEIITAFTKLDRSLVNT